MRFSRACVKGVVMSTKTPSDYAKEFHQMEHAYRAANTKSAEAVLSLCKVVFDASAAFGQDEPQLDSFRREAKLRNKSTYSQFRTIGAHYDRLNEHAAQLPSSWFTLYRIA